MRSRTTRVLVVAAALLGVVVTAPVAGAAAGGDTVAVPCSGDGGGPAGIAAAVHRLNQSGGGTVMLATSCVYTFPHPFAAGNATDKITGNITVVGNQASLVRDSQTEFRFFEVASGGALSLLHLTMKGGRQSTGGALLVDQGGTATLQSVRAEDNHAKPSGGAIHDEGTLHLEGSIVSHNSVATNQTKDDRTGFGGGVRITATGTADIASSDVTDNAVVASPLRPVLGGAGIFNDGQLTVRASDIKGNSMSTGEESGGSAAGAGIGNRGTLTLDHTKVEGNAIAMPRGGTSTGSGVWSAATFTSIASTISGNTATGERNVADGTGVYAAAGKVDLVDTHVTRNKATAVHARGSGVALSDSEPVDITVTNSPIVDNAPDNCFPATQVPTCTNTGHGSAARG